MTDPASATPRPRGLLRWVALGLGVVLLAVGAGLLALPYDTTVDIDAPAGTIFDPEPIEARCEAPILDAFHGEPEGWLNYTPEDGTTIDDGGNLTGTWCRPNSTTRLTVGLLLVVIGLAFAVTALALRRSKRARTEPPLPTVSADPTDATPPSGPAETVD